MSTYPLTDLDLKRFEKDGYLIKRSWYKTPEIKRLQDKAFSDSTLQENAWDKKDAQGASSKVSHWQRAGNTLYGMFARGRRMVDACTQLIGEPIYHMSTKIMMKEPFVGGAWEWHQDFGYWHHNGFLYPKNISVMIAINQANKENGCLQVLRGSHKIGRLDHCLAGEQQGVDLLFLEEAEKHHELSYVELAPGDTLFFHSNLLHKSNQNLSSKPRWSMICAYNAIANKPFLKSDSEFHPLHPVEDNAILLHEEKSVHSENI